MTDKNIQNMSPADDFMTDSDDNLAFPDANLTRYTRADDRNCTREKAYLAIIITILPLWATVTTLIVFVLLSFHRSLRATKVYDNCTKNTAQYPYYVEIRTGDTSSTYNRRRTTLTIDMFDDNQTTLARIAVPGHVIFGKKNSPVGPIDDEKFSELRVTRFWLYRTVKLKRISTIRLTHSCLEPEAKIMIYGVEIRSNERDNHKLFFPIMNYIAAYGSSAKPNACFDLEASGSISAMGGSQADTATVSKQLSWTDYTLLTYLLISIIFWCTTYEIVPNSSVDTVASVYRGAIVGGAAYFVDLIVGYILRDVIKYNYALSIGTGTWAILYYISCGILLIISTVIWIYTTVISYKRLCPDKYTMWLLSIGIAVGEAIALAVLTYLIIWIIQILNPKYTEQYTLPDDWVGNQEPPSRSRGHSQMRPQYSPGAMHNPNLSLSPVAWSGHGHSGMPVQYVVPTPGYHQTSGNMYGQPVLVNTPVMSVSPAAYKTLQTGYEPQPTNYNQANLHGIKPSGGKRVGSSESTGSSYYQQLMKNKGGVKSISQYGELLRQKKPAKHG